MTVHEHSPSTWWSANGARLLTAAIVVLGLGVVAYVAFPTGGLLAEIQYVSIALGASVVAALGVRLHRPRRPTGWILLVAGNGVWVLGDLIWSLEYVALESDNYPGVSDVFYLGAYVLLGAGGVIMIRTRAGRDLTALLDAAIAAAGVGVVLTVFVIIPLAFDSSETVFSRVVYTAYPLCDLLLLVVLVRLWTSPGAATWSYRLLMTAITTTFVVDIVYSLPILNFAEETPNYLEAGWLTAYLLLAAAAVCPSMLTLAEAPPMREQQSQGRSLAILTVASILPAVVLLVLGAAGRDIPWIIVGVGSLVLSTLVLARMSGLVKQVQQQSVQLAALARSDALTGAPNRRSWDHELSRACARARAERTTVCVAVIDLDHFKTFNDTHGHPAGDRLLREAVAAWTHVLGDDGLLARYGGEEFTVLTEELDLLSCTRLVERLQAVTPDGQTFSAGVARWDVTTDPSSVVTHADEALYEAKRAGRNQVVARGLELPQQLSPKPGVEYSAEARLEPSPESSLEPGLSRG
jgi:diguanylate cyclase (GGDEF)-like protein